MKLKMWIDGACRGNPGPGSIGVYVKNARGSVVAQISRAIGECTNNHAEYAALLEALKAGRRLNAQKLEIRSDSMLLVKQFSGAWKIKHPPLVQFMSRIRSEASKLEEVQLIHVRREFNKEADRLANEALDQKKGARYNKDKKTAGGSPDKGGTSGLRRTRRSSKGDRPRSQMEFLFDQGE